VYKRQEHDGSPTTGRWQVKIDEATGTATGGFDQTGAPAAKQDTVAMFNTLDTSVKNWNVFILACGAGASRGYRFWRIDDTPGNPSPLRALEPQTAEESGLFPDYATFRELKSGERVLFFRVEWSAIQGGAINQNVYNGFGTRWGGYDETGKTHSSVVGELELNEMRRTKTFNPGGNFKWIQRLDSEPAGW
jgi:hypothetical protein